MVGQQLESGYFTLMSSADETAAQVIRLFFLVQ